MNKKEACRIFGLLLLLSLAAAPAAAQQEGQVYLGASLGSGKSRTTCSRVVGVCDDSDTGYKLFGGYQMSRSFGWELGYGYLGDADTATFQRTSKALDFSGMFTLPVNERFALLGRLGVYRSQIEVHPASASAHNTSFTWGLGMRFDFFRWLAVRAEWQRYSSLGNDATGKDDIDLLTAGIVMPF